MGKGGPLPPLEGGRYQGRIKTFNSKQGFGFIDCLPASDKFGRDVFVHKAQMGDVPVGGEVTFEVRTNKDGHPQARDVRRLDGSIPGPYPDGDGEDANGGEGKGGRKKQRGARTKKGKNKEGKVDGKGEGKAKAKPPGPL